ncbi:MAG: hypothetical protein LC776_13515, partial [Acidobacteria bacterium]|nr:hypothetical protein [Acidobacteriota bacterium]
MENARSKVVFSMATRERNLSPLADWLYMGTFDPYKIKHQLYSTKVMDYAEETRTVTSRGESRGHGRSDMRGSARGSGNVHTAATSGTIVTRDPQPLSMWAMSDSQASSASDTTSYGDSESESVSESESEVPMLIPIMGKELSSVQFLSLEEQRFEAERRVMFQPNRHATARFVGMNVPVQLRTPEIKPSFIDEETTLEYRREQLAKWPFALSYEDANERLQKRTASLALPLAGETEPVKYRRPVSVRAKTKADAESQG